jgi:DNA-binding NarL/FixJ family response regulator
VRIMIADRRSAVRSAVRLLLEVRLELDVVGEASDGHELLAQLASLQPDIIVLDWELPGLSADGLFDALGELDRRPGVIVLGANQESRRASLAAGADAFVSKGEPPKRLLTAVQALSTESSREQ